MTVDVFAALAGRAVRLFFRSPQAVVMTVAFPLLLLFMLLAAFGQVVGDQGGITYADRLAPLVVLATITFGTSLTGMGFFADRTGGFLNRVRTMPVPGGAVVAGRLAGDLLRILVVAAFAAAVAQAGGFRFRHGPLAVLAFFGVVLLAAMMCTLFAAFAGLRFSAAGVQNALNLPALLLFFLSSGLVPVASFPGFLQPAVRANPMSIADNVLIGLSTGGPVRTPLLLLLCWAVGVTVVFGALTIRQFRLLITE